MSAKFWFLVAILTETWRHSLRLSRHFKGLVEIDQVRYAACGPRRDASWVHGCTRGSTQNTTSMRCAHGHLLSVAAVFILILDRILEILRGDSPYLGSVLLDQTHFCHGRWISFRIGDEIRSSRYLNFEEPDQTRCILDASPFEDNDRPQARVAHSGCYCSQEFATRHLLTLIDTLNSLLQHLQNNGNCRLSRHVFSQGMYDGPGRPFIWLWYTLQHILE